MEHLCPENDYLLLYGRIHLGICASYIKWHIHIRWETLFLLLEMIAVVFLGLLPESAPYRISQVVMNLFASMQYNTFRQAEHIPMAATFCTNHLRQISIFASRTLRRRDKNTLRRMLVHCRMLAAFVLGGTSSAVLCRYLLGKAILFTLIPLAYLFIDFLSEDIHSGQSCLERKPEGHWDSTDLNYGILSTQRYLIWGDLS